MPVRNDGIICRECGGTGCPACNQSGYSYRRVDEQPHKAGFADIPIVPMPYGKILPDLTGSHYDEHESCPGCGSNHVVALSSQLNPWIPEENETPGCRWFCITCQDSWCYERER